MTSTLLPNAKQTFTGPNGTPLSGGSVHFYIPGTTTPKDTYQDAAQTILNTNPVVLDANGQAVIWGFGSYRQMVYDVYGNLVWDQITQDLTGGLIGNITDNTYVAANGDFVPGTTTQLTLSSLPGSIANTWTFFDGVFQADDQASINGTTLTFGSPIPVGVQEVTVKVGNSTSIGTPSSGTVTDAAVAAGAGINSSKLAFLLGAGGAVSRTIQSRLSDWISAKDFGAKGDGVTDDTAALTNFFSALGSQWGGFLPAGTYNVSAGFSINTPVYVLGTKQSVIHNTNAGLTEPIIALSSTAAQGCVLENFGITSVATASPNAVGVELAGGEDFALRSLNISGMAVGISITAEQAGGIIDDCFVHNVSGNGFAVTDPNLVMSGCYADNTGAHGYAFLTSTGGAGATLVNCTSYQPGLTSFLFQGSANAPLIDIFLDQCVSSTSPSGSGYLFDTYGKNIMVTGCYCETAGVNANLQVVTQSHGFQFTANNRRVTLTGCQATFCSGAGAVMACGDFSITGGDFVANNISGQNFSGILVAPAAAVSRFSICGVNTAPDSPADVDYQKYGVDLFSAGCTSGVIAGCVLHGTDGGFSNVSSNPDVVLGPNAGFLSEARGVATIAAGSSSVTVNHGLGGTPAIALATPAGAVPTGISWATNSYTTTSFTIQLAAAAPGAISFGWLAKL